MRRLGWLVMLGACGKDASTPAQPPAKTPAPVVAVPVDANPQVAALERDIASARDAEAEMRRQADHRTKPLPAQELSGELVVGGKLADVTTLAPMFDLTACRPSSYGARIAVHAAHSLLLEIDVEAHADKAGAIALFRDDATHEHHGVVYARATAYVTDAAGKQSDETATKGNVVVHQLAAKVDVSIDAVFGTAGHLKGRFVADTPPSRGDCVVD